MGDLMPPEVAKIIQSKIVDVTDWVSKKVQNKGVVNHPPDRTLMANNNNISANNQTQS